MVTLAEDLQVLECVRAAGGQRADVVAIERVGRAALFAGLPGPGQRRGALLAINPAARRLIASPGAEALTRAPRLKRCTAVPTLAHRRGLLSPSFPICLIIAYCCILSQEY
jgi:hypothetical protein